MQKEITKALEELSKIQEKVEGFDSIVERVHAAMAAAGIPTTESPVGDNGYFTSIGWEKRALEGVLVRMQFLNVRSLLAPLRALRRAGFKMEKVDEFPEIGRRSYHFSDDVVFMAFFPIYEDKPGASCRYVPDGTTEVTTIQKYKLVCDETPEVEAPEETPPVIDVHASPTAITE